MSYRALAFLLCFSALACSNVTAKSNATAKLHGRLGMNDVSILFPLPPSGRLDSLMSARTAAAQGELLPYADFQLAPRLTPAHDRAQDYQHLYVVAARIDPCFPSLDAAPSPSCRFQVRLVLQPIYDEGGKVVAADAAIHAFYDLPVSDFLTLVGQLLDAQQAAAPLPSQAPLGVQPTLRAEGLDGPYATGIESALLSVVGKERLTRMTFAALGAQDHAQTYGGFDFGPDGAKPLAILDPGLTQQTFDNASQDDLAFEATVLPALADPPEDLGPLLDSASAEKLDDAAKWSLYQSTLRIENPGYYSSESMDCVSCHAAQLARRWLERNGDFATRPSKYRYQSDFDLSDAAAFDDTRTLRAFGWQGDRPSINTRVVHETAAVAAYLNRQLLE